MPGTWSWWAFSKGGGLPDEPVELVAYADNRELRGRVWFDDFRADGSLVVYAKLFFRYPLSGLDVTLGLYRQGRLIAELPMFDDGAEGIDLQPGDGIYSAVVDVAELLPGREPGIARPSYLPPPQTLRVEVRFQVTEASGPAPNAIYEVGITPEMVGKDYARANRATFAAWASGVINLGDLYRPEDERVPRLELPAGRQPVAVVRGQKGTLRVRLFNLLSPPAQLRLSLGAGVEASVVADPDAADDDPGAGQALLVDFAVAADAEPGPRALTLQFQEQMARLADVLEVGAEPAAPTRPDGWKLLLALMIVLLFFWWLRRQLH
jgi:hypothetical protein